MKVAKFRALSLLRRKPAPTPPSEPAQAKRAPTRIEPGLRDVQNRLRASGTSSALTERVLRTVVKSRAGGAYAIDVAARELERAFPIQSSPKRSQAPHFIAFVGPAGAGKTSTVAKLGRKMAQFGRRVLFISMDPAGAATLEAAAHVRADRDRTEIPLAFARRASDVKRLLRKHEGLDAVLIDTPGYSPGADRELQVLKAELDRLSRVRPLDVYLCLAASSGPSALQMAGDALGELAPTAGVVTKLDETRAPTPALEQFLRMRLPIAFLCDGTDLRGNLIRPRPTDFADLALRGRLA